MTVGTPWVIDASAAAEILLWSTRGQAVGAEALSHDLHAPSLLVAEVTSVLRGWVLSHQIDVERALLALADLRDLPLTLADDRDLAARALDHAHNVSAYDAMYVALAETLSAPLLTLDQRLLRACRGMPGVRLAAPDPGA